jgi:hypothetical protein
VASGALHPAGRIQLRKETDEHALSLPTAAPLGKPCCIDVLEKPRSGFSSRRSGSSASKKLRLLQRLPGGDGF